MLSAESPAISSYPAYSLSPVCDEKLPDEVFCEVLDDARPLHLPAENLLVDAERVVRVEGGEAGQHLINEDPQRPPVH